MLMYDEVIRRIDARQEFPAQTVIDAVGIVRNFIEDYNEKIEEEHLFPPFRKLPQGRSAQIVCAKAGG